MKKQLIVVTGPTASGKTAYAIDLARRLGSEVVNADSRQVYREIPIGTAAPTADEQALVRHHFVGVRSVTEPYNASDYERDVLALLPSLWERCGGTVVLCGGSMMYVDAVCRGIDRMPDVPPELRAEIKSQIAAQGLEPLLEELRERDPEYYAVVDKRNPVRVQRAIEMCRLTGGTYTALRTGEPAKRDFEIKKIGLKVDRGVLCDRIDRRVDAMIEQGLVDEARAVYRWRHLQSLNTVGYKELFAYFDGTFTLDEAVEKIKRNTRVYAKKQMTWLRRDASIEWKM